MSDVRKKCIDCQKDFFKIDKIDNKMLEVVWILEVESLRKVTIKK